MAPQTTIDVGPISGVLPTEQVLAAFWPVGKKEQ